MGRLLIRGASEPFGGLLDRVVTTDPGTLWVSLEGPCP